MKCEFVVLSWDSYHIYRTGNIFFFFREGNYRLISIRDSINESPFKSNFLAGRVVRALDFSRFVCRVGIRAIVFFRHASN